MRHGHSRVCILILLPKSNAPHTLLLSIFISDVIFCFLVTDVASKVAVGYISINSLYFSLGFGVRMMVFNAPDILLLFVTCCWTTLVKLLSLVMSILRYLKWFTCTMISPVMESLYLCSFSGDTVNFVFSSEILIFYFSAVLWKILWRSCSSWRIFLYGSEIK